MVQKIEILNEDDKARLAAQRKWVREHYEPDSEHKYDTLNGKLSLLDTIIKNKWIEKDETVKLQCLGVTLGDALVQNIGLEWVVVEDEYGRDPAIALQGTSIVLFPLTMISKRIERGETVDVFEMFSLVCQKVEELAKK